ncbi:hypothetical protein [Parabacteroides goldsteinii]|uniref:hypothetical protein n=1 Tax=Parabacteroides goldsteinii TaxID=328812 RepID=UPI00101BC706|nr:hypothetical protein [Parabacteroides goldsteinii]
MIDRYRVHASRWYRWPVSGQWDGQPSSGMRSGQPANRIGSGPMIGRYWLLAVAGTNGRYPDNRMDNHR